MGSRAGGPALDGGESERNLNPVRAHVIETFCEAGRPPIVQTARLEPDQEIQQRCALRRPSP